MELLDLARVEMNGQAVFDYFESCDLLDQGQSKACESGANVIGIRRFKF